MSTIRSSAAGKLFLLGEYAVLEGAPALLTAVDRRVQVTIGHRGRGRWSVSAPTLGIESRMLEADGSLPATLDARTRSQLRVFDAVRSAIAGTARQLPEGLAITVDSGALWHEGHKLGLGSSAAVAVALTAALAEATELTVPAGAAASAESPLSYATLCDLATSAHREAQGGTGSGGDVAASFHGGLIAYSRGMVPTPLAWPEDLTMMAVITGTGSSTTELVGRVNAYAQRDRTGYRADLARLTELAEHAKHALTSADAFLAVAADYFEALSALDAHAHAGIISKRHRELHAVAGGLGSVFKTSGAGGGDLGLAFSRSGAQATELAAALSAAHAQIVPLGFGAAEVTVEVGADTGPDIDTDTGMGTGTGTGLHSVAEDTR